jgi:hypothetical protein
VFVVRGIAGYWPCLCAFEEALRNEGVRPKAAFAETQRLLADEITAGRDSGRLRGPLVIVGYSTGANSAIGVCRRLAECGITVDKLVLLETSYEEAIPGNVRSCFNIYKSQPHTDWIPIFRGLPLHAASGATELVNYDVRCADSEFFFWENHLTICANPYVHDLMVDQVLDALEEGGSGNRLWRCPPRECR